METWWQLVKVFASAPGAVVLLAALALNAYAQQEPMIASVSQTVESEDQLRELKQSLLTLAMEGKARVAASGWTNSRGTLREDVMVFSDLQLEQLRPTVNGTRYGKASLTYADKSAAQGCQASSPRPQRVGLNIAIEPSASASASNMAAAAGAVVEKSLAAGVRDGGLARIATLQAAASTQAVLSAYQHHMTAGPARVEDLQLRVRIEVSEGKTIAQRLNPIPPIRRGMRLKLVMSLIAADQVVADWQETLSIGSSKQATRNQLAWIDLPQGTTEALQQWLQTTLGELNTAIHCHGQTAILLTASAAQMTLQGGTDIGIYPGQRMAILPTSHRFRSRGLQSSLAVIGLAEVTQVGPHSAMLNVYAGPPPEDAAGMMALPISSF